MGAVFPIAFSRIVRSGRPVGVGGVDQWWDRQGCLAKELCSMAGSVRAKKNPRGNPTGVMRFGLCVCFIRMDHSRPSAQGLPRPLTLH